MNNTHDTTEVRFDTGTVGAGKDVRVSVNYSAANGGSVTFTPVDLTTGYTPMPVHMTTASGLPLGSYVRGGTAEWVNERPTNFGLAFPVDGRYYYLREPSATITWNAASFNNTTFISATDPNEVLISMARPISGVTLEVAGQPISSHGGWLGRWIACA